MTTMSFHDAIAQFQNAVAVNANLSAQLAAAGLDVSQLASAFEALANAVPQNGEEFDIAAFQSYFAQIAALQPQLLALVGPMIPIMMEFMTSTASIVAAHMADWVKYGFDDSAFNLVHAIGETGEELFGAATKDFISGLVGDDYIAAGGDDDILTGNDGNDIAYGNQGADLLYGNLGADFLFGGQADDILFGGKGDDELVGGIGADSIFGNQGADTMTGGEGADSFVGGLFGGDDVITDFEVGVDVIHVIGLVNEQDVLDHAVEVDGGVKLTYEEGSITLMGVTLAELSIDIFAHA